MRYKKKLLIYCIPLFLFATFLSLAARASHYLAYADIPFKSDVIVLLASGDVEAKKKEAHRLINEGRATYLMIPSRKELLHLTRGGNLCVFPTTDLHRQSLTVEMDNLAQNNKGRSGWRYERTHIQVMVANEMMEKAGFSSAIFMSHPYHMRRIKMIASRLFAGNDYRLYFVPTNREKLNGNTWLMNKNDRQWVVREYIKIAWFLLYTYIPFFSPTQNI